MESEIDALLAVMKDGCTVLVGEQLPAPLVEAGALLYILDRGRLVRIASKNEVKEAGIEELLP